MAGVFRVREVSEEIGSRVQGLGPRVQIWSLRFRSLGQGLRFRVFHEK